MSNDNSYNGWTNHATWALNLWFSNDRGMYDYVQETIEEYKEQGLTKDQATIELEHFFENFIDEQVGIVSETFPMMADFLDTDAINYTEVAEAWLDEYDNGGVE